MDPLLLTIVPGVLITATATVAANVAMSTVVDSASQILDSTTHMAKKAVDTSLMTMQTAQDFFSQITKTPILNPSNMMNTEIHYAVLEQALKNKSRTSINSLVQVSKATKSMLQPLRGDIPMPTMRSGLTPISNIKSVRIMSMLQRGIARKMLSTPLLGVGIVEEGDQQGKLLSLLSVEPMPSIREIGIVDVSSFGNVSSSMLDSYMKRPKFASVLTGISTTYTKVLTYPFKETEAFFHEIEDFVQPLEEELLSWFNNIITFGTSVEEIITRVTGSLQPVIFDIQGTTKTIFSNLSKLRIPEIPFVGTIPHFPGFPGTNAVNVQWFVKFVEEITHHIPIIGWFVDHIVHWIEHHTEVFPAIPDLPQLPDFSGTYNFPGFSFVDPLAT